MARRNYARLLDRVVKSKLKPRQKVVLLTLISMTRSGQSTCYASTALLSTVMTMGRTAISDGLKALRGHKLITSEIGPNFAKHEVDEDRAMMLGNAINGDPLFLPAAPEKTTNESVDADGDGSAPTSTPKPASHAPADPRRAPVTDEEIPAELLDADGNGAAPHPSPDTAPRAPFASREEALAYLEAIGEKVGDAGDIRTTGPTPAPAASDAPSAPPAPDGAMDLFSELSAPQPAAAPVAPPRPKTEREERAEQALEIYTIHADLLRDFNLANDCARRPGLDAKERAKRNATIERSRRGRDKNNKRRADELDLIATRLKDGFEYEELLEAVRGAFNRGINLGVQERHPPWEWTPQRDKPHLAFIDILTAKPRAGEGRSEAIARRIELLKDHAPGEGEMYLWQDPAWPNKPTSVRFRERAEQNARRGSRARPTGGVNGRYGPLHNVKPQAF